MHEIDNQKFGEFLIKLRKQKGFTQKELAQKLIISDKAISKWERGLSMPDISLLMPLADIFDVSITELLLGEYISQPEKMNVKEVEKLVEGTINLSAKEEDQKSIKRRKKRGLIYIICLAIIALEFTMLYRLGYAFEQLADNLLTVEVLNLIFGCWMGLLAKQSLPAYYDENKVDVYCDGMFKIRLMGVHFNNSNWKHILKAGWIWSMSAAVLFPMVYFVLSSFLPAIWQGGKLFFLLFFCLGIFIPMMIAAKRCE